MSSIVALSPSRSAVKVSSWTNSSSTDASESRPVASIIGIWKT
jgi:hypothetical protein